MLLISPKNEISTRKRQEPNIFLRSLPKSHKTHWDDILRLMVTIKLKATMASQLSTVTHHTR